MKPQRREVYEMSETIMNTEEIMTTIRDSIHLTSSSDTASK